MVKQEESASRVSTSSNIEAMDEIDRIVAEWNRVRPDLDVSPTHTRTGSSVCTAAVTFCFFGE